MIKSINVFTTVAKLLSAVNFNNVFKFSCYSIEQASNANSTTFEKMGFCFNLQGILENPFCHKPDLESSLQICNHFPRTNDFIKFCF